MSNMVKVKPYLLKKNWYLIPADKMPRFQQLLNANKPVTEFEKYNIGGNINNAELYAKSKN